MSAIRVKVIEWREGYPASDPVLVRVETSTSAGECAYMATVDRRLWRDGAMPQRLALVATALRDVANKMAVDLAIDRETAASA